jgi:hypothetical protein
MWRNVVSALGILLLSASAALAQDRPTIEQQPLTCIPTHCGRARVVATVHSTAAPRFVRVYFRAADQPGEYYVEMKKGAGDTYWAVFPAVADSTSGVSYRVVARDEKGAESSTEAISVPTTSGCAGASLTAEENGYASNVALGLTTADASPVPAGFRCAGIVSQVSATGEVVSPNENCRQVVMANADESCVTRRPKVAVYTPAQAAVFAAGGAALAVAGGAATYKHNQGSQKPISTARP